MSTITTIQETDIIANSRAVINTNFSNLNTDAGKYIPVTTITVANTPYTATTTESVILADSTLGAITVNLPTAVGKSGRSYTVKDWKGQATTRNITITPNGSEKIDGLSTKVINGNYISVTLISDNANWSII